ncbi:MAG: XRE family transcriptional regulator [Pseudomonadota bacterium]
MAKTKPVRPEYLDFARRLKAGMAAKQLDQSTVARALGIEPQSVQQWLAGQTMPRGYRIKALAALLDVEPWELLGSSTPVEDAGGNRFSAVAPGGIRRVPRISWVSAGQFREIEVPYSGQPEAWDTPTEPLGPRAFSLRVEGDSMEPEFPAGCIIFVEPDTQAVNGDYVVVTVDDTNQATFKQLVIDGPRRYLKPLNPRYPVIPIEREARICGVVREMRKAYPRR